MRQGVAQIRDGKQPVIAALDGVRGFAILLVFGVHYTVAWNLLFPAAANDATATGLIADMLFSLGNAGVDLFMALSGYLIYDHLMRRPAGFGPYFARRCRRIFPPYLIVLGIYVALMLADPAKSKLPADGWAAGAYILESALLVPAFFGHAPIVGIAWSLTYEMLFYLLLPLVVIMCGLRRRGDAGRMFMLFGVSAVLLAFAWYVEFHERTVMFLGGMLARDWLVRVRYTFARPAAMDSLAGLLAVFAVAYIVLWRGPAPFVSALFPASFARALVLAVAFPVIIAVALGVRGMWCRVFEFLPLRLLGEISYSFYLLHNLTMRIVLGFLMHRVGHTDPAAFYWLAMPAAFLLCLVPGLAMYALVERPLSLRRPIGLPSLRAHAAA